MAESPAEGGDLVNLVLPFDLDPMMLTPVGAGLGSSRDPGGSTDQRRPPPEGRPAARAVFRDFPILGSRAILSEWNC